MNYTNNVNTQDSREFWNENKKYIDRSEDVTG